MSGIEEALVDYILHSRYEDLPSDIGQLGKNLILTNLGTTIAGAGTEGCETLFRQIEEWGGKEEATVWLHGKKVPAHNAVLINSYMARALDFDDGIRPGMHKGASAVAAAFAASELSEGCSGKDFLTALVVGAEVADRINVVSAYDGFDPTGICAVFAAAGAAAKILRLNKEQIWNTLAIAFNKSGGSFQSNIEGALTVRLIQGFTSQSGILSAQLAKKGFTGPKQFLVGTYGYFHLYAKDHRDPGPVTGDLGKRFELSKTIFKKYPSCADTSASTDAILQIAREKGVYSEDVDKIEIQVTPYVFKLVGNPFRIRENPRVDAQFNIPYCVANGLLRRNSLIEHFEESSVRDPRIMEIAQKIKVSADPNLDKRGETALEMQVFTKGGAVYRKSIDFPTGFPENPLTPEENMERFRNCIRFAKKSPPPEKIEELISLVRDLEKVEDVRGLIPLLSYQS
jgi:2-methylcitrate dehydratase PrpD